MSTLRIVGGRLGGRRFAGPKSAAVRPTSERVREAVASALEARGAIEGAEVVDLFAGTGALAFEALSRGAARATVVDRDRRLLRALERTARDLGLAENVRSVCVDLLKDPDRAAETLASAGPFTLVFVDPPYAQVDAAARLLDALIDRGTLAEGAWVVLEHASSGPAPAVGLASVTRYRYGDTGVELGTVPPRRAGETAT